MGCPDPPEIIIQGGPLHVRIGLLLLESLGLHGIVGMVGGTFIILGFTKLAFGQILFCRKTKAQVQLGELRAAGIEIPESVSHYNSVIRFDHFVLQALQDWSTAVSHVEGQWRPGTGMREDCGD